MANTEDLGISYVHGIVAQMGFFFREQPKHDFGIDAHLEISDDTGKGSGRLVGLQIKSGKSYIRRTSGGSIAYYADKRHIIYWAEHSLPVVLIVYSPNENRAWWVDIKEYISQRPTMLGDEGGCVIKIPNSQIFDENTKNVLENLANTPSDKLDLDERKYSLATVEDFSTGQAKRISSHILVGMSVGKAGVRLAIYQATQELKSRIEHSTEKLEKHWKNQKPHIILLYVYRDTDDISWKNWIAHSQWQAATDNFYKMPTLKTNDFVEDILVEFRDKKWHSLIKDNFSKNPMTKTEYIKHVIKWINLSDKLLSEAESLFSRYKSEEISEPKFIAEMTILADSFDKVSTNYDNGQAWPSECEDLANFFAGAIGCGINIFLPFGIIGRGKWDDARRRDYLIKSNLERYQSDREMVQFELKKLKRR